MMPLIKKLNLLILFLLFFQPVLSVWSADFFTSRELINKAKELDGQIVKYKGEVIGDILRRGNYAWVNVNDGQSAIGIWCKLNDIKDIRFIGKYKSRGDIVLVEGVLNRTCREHGGDLDIHANKITVVEPGFYLFHPIIRSRVILSLVLFFLTLMAGIFYKLRISWLSGREKS